MSNLVIRLNVVSPDASLPVIPASDLVFPTVDYETDAWDFFALDGTDASLTGKNRGSVLTKQGTVTPDTGFFTIPIGAATKNALVSSFPDSHEQTQIAVMKLPSTMMTAGMVPLLMGRLSGTSASGAGSAAYIRKNGSVWSISRVFFPRAAGALINEQDITSLIGKWVIVALAETSDSSTRVSRLFVSNGAAPYSVELSEALGKVLATGGVGIGNLAYNTSGSDLNYGFAEYGIWDRKLTNEELLEVYNRAKVRMAVRGFDLI